MTEIKELYINIIVNATGEIRQIRTANMDPNQVGEKVESILDDLGFKGWEDKDTVLLEVLNPDIPTGTEDLHEVGTYRIYDFYEAINSLMDA